MRRMVRWLFHPSSVICFDAEALANNNNGPLLLAAGKDVCFGSLLLAGCGFGASA